VSDFILPKTPEAGEPREPRVLDYDGELATLRDLRSAVVDLAHGVMTDSLEAESRTFSEAVDALLLAPRDLPGAVKRLEFMYRRPLPPGHPVRRMFPPEDGDYARETRDLVGDLVNWIDDAIGRLQAVRADLGRRGLLV
jgi:hypothetical protein